MSGEYEYPVAGEDWWVAGFIDAGNAFETQDIQLKVGYGLGVRWYSPIGRVRLDLAFPDDTTKDDWRLHFGLGKARRVDRLTVTWLDGTQSTWHDLDADRLVVARHDDASARE